MQAGQKRRNIEDFFTPTKSRCLESNQQSRPRRADLSHVVPGLSIYHEFATPGEESEVVAFLDRQKWRTDLARRVIHYGGSYCLMPPKNATPEERKKIESTIITADPLPKKLDFLLDRMIERGLYTDVSKPGYCIVNEYKDSRGISAHIENLKFGSPVCGLTLCNGDYMRFRELTRPDDGSVRSGKAAKAERTGKLVDVFMPRRSLLVMRGEAREKWQHEIVRGRKGRDGKDWRRISLTFRSDRS